MGNGQNALSIITHIQPTQVEALNQLLTEIGNDLPKNPYVRFAEFEAVHFACWVIIADDPAYQPSLVLEVNHDGAAEDLLSDLVSRAAPGLEAIYQHCVGYPAEGVRRPEEVKRYLSSHAVETVAFYVGCPGQTVGSIRNAIAVREEVEHSLDREAAKVPLSGLSAVKVHEGIKQHLATASPVKPVVSPVTLVQQRQRARRNLLLLALLGIPLGLLCLPLLLLWFIALRIHEVRDNKRPLPSPRPLDPRLLRGDLGTQNHLTTLVEVRPGAFRLYTLKGVLWLVNLLAKKYFTTGQLGGIPTIHFARWLFMDGNRRLLFFSNYDGSWASYLGDFVDRAAYGLTGIWGNTLDFPPTNYLVLGGARHIDAFKQWSHEHNVFAPVFYRAYPDETIWNLQKDLEFRDGVGQTLDAEEAEKLLRLL